MGVDTGTTKIPPLRSAKELMQMGARLRVRVLWLPVRAGVHARRDVARALFQADDTFGKVVLGACAG